MDVVFKDRVLPTTTLHGLPRVSAIEDDKTVDARVDALVERSRQTRIPEPVDWRLPPADRTFR